MRNLAETVYAIHHGKVEKGVIVGAYFDKTYAILNIATDFNKTYAGEVIKVSIRTAEELLFDCRETRTYDTAAEAIESYLKAEEADIKKQEDSLKQQRIALKAEGIELYKTI
jgi:hypothetical protein